MRAIAAAPLALLLAAPVAFAQTAPPLDLPQPSPKARVEQTVGLTEMAVSYHRPAVKGRKVFGGLEKFGEVWRAGANENTTVSFSSEVSVEGKKLPAGTYGLHMIPQRSQPWTVIFSRVNTAWGSYGYDAKDDAVRVNVTPGEGTFEERLSFSFDDPTDTAVTLALHWDKVRVPIRVAVDTGAVVSANLRGQLRGLHQFFPQSYAAAANWCVQHDTNLDEASQWVEKSIGMQKNFGNQMVKAALLEKKGDAAGASTTREAALAKASENELNTYAYGLLGGGKAEQAIAIFQRIVKEHPESWNAHDSLAEAYETTGNKAGALEHYEEALKRVKDPQHKLRLEKTVAGLRQ